MSLFSQVMENFDDGNISENPPWCGDTNDFVVNAHQQLQLDATQAGESAICVNIEDLNVWNQEMEWYFWIELGFAPSNNNFSRIYLLSNTSDLKSDSLRAFYLQFGENLSQDAIELFYTENGQTSSVLRGPDAMIAGSFDLKVKVAKTANDEWSLWIDEPAIGWYRMLTSALFEKRFESKYAGIYCKYTAGNATKFYYDDLYVGPALIDSISPVVNFCFGNDDFQTVSVTFSEIVNETSLESVNYVVEENGESPLACEYSFPNYNQVILYFSCHFDEDRVYHLKLKNMEDLSGNVISDTVISFFCHKIKRNDVIISEIMADPNPAVNLPEVEYVELYNRVEGKVLLSGWKLQLGKTLKTLPDILLSKDGFAVIAAENNVEIMRDFCENTVGVSSLSITDGGQDLILYNSYDEVVYAIRFSNDWHRNTIKKDGGWSLEMIDTDNPCGMAENWDSSVDDWGGTPGRSNSIKTENPDTESPVLVTATILDSNKIRLFFSETVSLIAHHPVFVVDHGIGITRIALVQPNQTAVDVVFDQALREGTIYCISVNDTICDCAGVQMQVGSSLLFGLDHHPQSGDLILNEVLFDPPGSEDADYVEVYNRSDYIIDLKKVKIGSGGDELPEKAVLAQSFGFQLFPKKMAALCKNKKLTYQHFLPPDYAVLLQCDSLPAFANAEGVVHLTDVSLNRIDRFSYDAKMHYTMLTSTDGVS